MYTSTLEKRKAILLTLNRADMEVQYRSKNKKIATLLNDIREVMAEGNSFNLCIDKLSLMSPMNFGRTAKKRKWIYAKTMINNPHEYTLLQDKDDPKVWFAFVRFIDKNAVTESYEGRVYKVYYAEDGFKYWFMDRDVSVTDLINRQEICMQYKKP